HNDYATLPHRKGLPEGHAQVIRELVVPILRGDRIVSILGVGNKPSDYTEKDVELVSYLADVTWEIAQRKRAEEALKESEEKFRHLVWDMQVGILLQGPQAEILLSNPKALELLGINEDQLLGKTLFDPDWNVIHEDGSPFPGSTHPVPQAIATRHSVQNVVMGVYRPTKGDRVWLLVDAEPQLNDDGTVKQIVCSFIDITERKRAIDALRESETKFRRAIDYAPIPIMIRAENGQVLAISQAWTDISGYT
ncbi:partial Virulence sensor protein BvgS, partial [Anaerolineae bacterium]